VGGEDLDTRGTVVDEDAPPLPAGLAANGWLVADAGTGTVLAARDPHGRFYPASTLKTLTLLTLLPVLDPAEVVTATAEDEQMEGSRVGIVTGGRYPVQLLFQGLVLQSGNDAANALARTAGGVEETVGAMNETAAELGAFDTVAGSPSGLDVAGQSSSPYDLALIFRALIDDPAAVEILRTPTAQMPPVPGRSPGYQIQNQDPLLGTYPGAIGGKTGFTDAARHTFVGAAERGGRVLVVSVMDTENEPLRAADQARLLLDWGFALPDDVDGVGELVEPGEVPAEGTPTPIPRPAPAVPVVPDEQAAAAPAADDDAPLVPWVLGGTAVLIVGATLIGRHRALRPLPASASRPGSPPGDRAATSPPPDGSRSTKR
jgi:D-alanyl-D-alanine carboxypeptidase (penicillin-binding protein 5/6)